MHDVDWCQQLLQFQLTVSFNLCDNDSEMPGVKGIPKWFFGQVFLLGLAFLENVCFFGLGTPGLGPLERDQVAKHRFWRPCLQFEAVRGPVGVVWG